MLSVHITITGLALYEIRILQQMGEQKKSCYSKEQLKDIKKSNLKVSTSFKQIIFFPVLHCVLVTTDRKKKKWYLSSGPDLFHEA